MSNFPQLTSFVSGNLVTFLNGKIFDDIDAMRDVYSKLLENQPILNDRKDDDSNFQIRHKSVVNIDFTTRN